jgi:hypothetical protein
MYAIRNIMLKHHIVRQCLLISARSTSAGVDTCLHVLYVSAFCGHYQVHRAFKIILTYVCCTSLHWSVVTHRDCVVQIHYLCSDLMLWNILNIEFYFIFVNIIISGWN